MIAISAHPEELSTFVRNALRRLTATSTITIEHAMRGEAGETVLDRMDLGQDELRALDGALRSRTTCAARAEAYLQAPAVARMLGIKTGTLAKWRRLGTGPNGWMRMNRTSVTYPIAEVEAFVANRKWETSNANRHPKIQKSCSGLEMESTN